MIILGVVAVFLYFESSQNTEKVTIQIPVSEISEIIKDPLKLDAKTEPIHELPVLDCSGVARCLKGKVTKIIDGDTINVMDNLLDLHWYLPRNW